MISTTVFIILVLILFAGLVNVSYGHTVDSVGDYRLEIGWMSEPAVSGETNGIELFVSPLDPNIPLENQEFKNGITGLEKALKIQMVFRGEKVTLPLKDDHNVNGKYFALIDPTLGGYYQANILGDIQGTQVSLSMHPPRVENKTYLEFPSTTNRILTEHNSLRDEINQIKDSLERIEDSNPGMDFSSVGIVFGIAGIVIASIALSRKKLSTP